MDGRTNLLDLNRETMECFFTNLGEKPFRACQVLKWIYQFGVDDLELMTNLSKPLRARLKQIAYILAPRVISEQISRDGTRKWLLSLNGGNCIETVFIPEPGRGTLCVSSQIGCALDCSFCSTGKRGFSRNLSVSEIIGQLWIATRRLGHKGHRPITNVVMMGMGEPLLNFDNVVQAMDLMMDDVACGLGRRRVTLSTAGIVPGIDRLRQASAATLAVSLHAPNDRLRDQLVPVNRKYPIDALLAACRRFLDARDSRTRITFEYVMLAGVNDSEACARELATRLCDLRAKVNLIPFNRFPTTGYKRSTSRVIDRFRDILMESGLITITRKTRGDDIDAACGQLVGRVVGRGARYRRENESRLEGAL